MAVSSRVRAVLAWGGLSAAIVVPIAIAANSPLLAWREPTYILAGFAGVVAMALLLLQPLLAAGALPGFPRQPGRRLHVWIGGGLVALVLVHVGGLWLTSPPDVIDVLLFRSPTPFSIWGALAMWAVFSAALLAMVRRRLRPALWRLAHTSLAIVIVATSVAHAMLIEGTMGTVSKAVLCGLALLATAKAVIELRAWSSFRRRRA